jgi:hypothetical protein
MQRMSGRIIVALLLILAGCLFWLAPRHPTSPLSGKLPLAIAEAVPALQRGDGPNLASQVADFAGGHWRLDGLTLVPGAAVAPDGSKSAARLDERSDYGWHRIEASVHGVTAGTVHTLSLFVKSAGPVLIQFEMRDANFGKYGVVQYNLQDRAVVYESGDVDRAGMQALPDGWLRCWAVMPYSSDNAVFNFALMSRHAERLYKGNSSTGLLIWGVQFEPGDGPRAYAAAQGTAAR